MLRRLAEWSAIALLGVILLLVLELSVRAWSRLQDGEWPQTPMQAFYAEIEESFSLYRRHSYLNTSPREGHAASAFGKHATFNSLGYRSPERPLEKPPGTKRIVIAGGSTTFDLLAADDRSTWASLLEEALRQKGCEVEIWNAGFPGWTSAENAIGLLLRDLDLEPDLVMLFQGINDLQAASLEPFDRHYESHAAEARRALGFELPPLAWTERSLLLERLRGDGEGDGDPWSRVGPGDSRHRIERLPDVSIAVFERNIRAVASLAIGEGARVLLMTQTLRLRADHRESDRRYLGGWLPGLEPDAAPRELERLNEVLRQLATPPHGPAELVETAREIEWNDGDFGDPMHFSAKGSQKLASYLAPVILEREVCAVN